MIKTIIFDLDGVLVRTKKIHYDTLNQALLKEGPEFVIDWNDHINIYDGLKTKQKLELLHKNKGLARESFDRVWELKQQLTVDSLEDIEASRDLIDCLSKLKNSYYNIVCCSNSIRKTVFIILCKLGIIKYFDLIISNEDISSSKPHPEIFWKGMSMMKSLPEETLILEDSPNGLLAANRSKAHILRIQDPSQVNYTTISNKINSINSENIKPPKWIDKTLNVLIPMAGAGSRFEKAGYTFPKPLIDVDGRPMIQTVIENINIDANYIFIVQKSHREKYNLDTLLNIITSNCKIVEVDGITEGAACTTLLAKDLINNNNSLIIANSDQFVEWDSNEFMYHMNESNCDAGILTFKSIHPKWSFVKINDSGFVTEVAEKKPISDIATVGIYYWKHGSDYVKYSEEMIKKNIRVNNEFYVCPVFNEAIYDNKKIKIFNIEKMYGLGTPEDLEIFLKQKTKIL
jgi:HAD superfamily hydrolase (TIGR01509 family)